MAVRPTRPPPPKLRPAKTRLACRAGRKDQPRAARFSKSSWARERSSAGRGAGAVYPRPRHLLSESGRRSGAAGAEHCPQDPAPRGPARSPAAGRHRAGRTGKNRRRHRRYAAHPSRRTLPTGAAISRTQLDPADLPEIVEDPAQPPDRCTLETSMGTAVIGLEVQLKEIEQGLMDLLAARPGETTCCGGSSVRMQVFECRSGE